MLIHTCTPYKHWFRGTEGPAINVVQRKIVEMTTRGTTSYEIYVYIAPKKF